MTTAGPRRPDAAGGETDVTAVLPADAVPAVPPIADGDGDRDGALTSEAPEEPQPPRGRSRARRMLVEWVALIAIALLIAFLIKTFLFQAFYIPSASMEPTLNIGDRVLVNKLSYDFHDVHRGDIVVFTAPPAARSGDIEDLVKRVIGLPGDTVTGDPGGSVLINGHRLKEPYLPARTRSEFHDVPPGCGTPADGAPGCVVPRGRVFVMGDNRGASKDARVFGPIKESSIVGRVFVRIWPLDDLGFL